MAKAWLVRRSRTKQADRLSLIASNHQMASHPSPFEDTAVLCGGRVVVVVATLLTPVDCVGA